LQYSHILSDEMLTSYLCIESA